MGKFKHILTAMFMASCTLIMGIALVWAVVANCDITNTESVVMASVVSIMGAVIIIVSFGLLLEYIKEGES